MTLQPRFLFHSAHRPVWWLVLLAGLWTNVGRADLIVGNASPMDQAVFEHSDFGFVTFTVMNTGLDDVRLTDFIAKASPRFG